MSSVNIKVTLIAVFLFITLTIFGSVLAHVFFPSNNVALALFNLPAFFAPGVLAAQLHKRIQFKEIALCAGLTALPFCLIVSYLHSPATGVVFFVPFALVLIGSFEIAARIWIRYLTEDVLKKA